MADMSKRKKWIIGLVAAVVVLGVIGAVASGGKKSGTDAGSSPAVQPAASTSPQATPASEQPKEQPKGDAKLDSEGTATSETTVGGDATWTATVKNSGGTDIENLEASCDFGGMDLISIEPQPVEHPIQDVQYYGPLKAGASVTITFHLLAKKVGVAEGLIVFCDKGNSMDSESGLHPNTIVR